MTFPGLRPPRLESPLLRRELVGLLRTKRAFWLLLATTAVSGLFPLLLWPRESSSMRENTGAFFAFAAVQLTAALLFIPAFTAGAISGEREAGTYDLLYATLLSPLSIVLAKAAASVGYVLLLLIASAPALCVIYLLGGVSFETVLQCQAITFAAVVMSGLVCLHASMKSERTARAAVRGVVWIFLLNGGFVIVFDIAAAIVFAIWGPVRSPPPWLVLPNLTFSPYPALAATVFENGRLPFLAFPNVWLLFLAYAGVLSFFYLLGLLRRVRVPELAPSRRRERKLARMGRRHAPSRRSYFTMMVLGLGDTEAVRLPVFFKELRSEFFGRRAFRAWAFWGALLLIAAPAILMLSQGHGSYKYSPALSWIGCSTLGLLALLVPAVTASAFPREIEQGNLDFLRGTLTPLREVLTGKFLAGMYAVAGVFAVGAIGMGITGLLWLGDRAQGSGGWDPQPSLFLPLLLLLATLFAFNAISTLASVASKGTLGALVIAYGTLALWLLVLPIFLAFARASDPMTATNPMAAMLAMGFRKDYTTHVVVLVFLEVGLSLACWVVAANLAESRWSRDR